MTDIPAPKIEFPCENYPLKVIGNASDDFAAIVATIIQRHAPEFDAETISVQASSNGRFSSVRMRICATGVEQLEAIHLELRATGRVHMVL